jgi:hypothetical protein
MTLTGRLLWRPTAGSARIWAGFGWFVAQMIALSVGVQAVAVVFATAGGFSAWQVLSRWVPRPTTASLVVAAVFGAAMPLAGVVGGAQFIGGALLFGVFASFGLADLVRFDGAGRTTRAGWLIQSWFPAGLGGACVVLTASYELGAAVILLWLIAVYDAGEYLVGADASSVFLGPLAGVLGAWITAFTVVELGIPPLDGTSVWRFGVMASIALPLGSISGSLLLPAASSRAPMMRRLDSLIVMAPAWAWMTGLLLQDL